MNCRVISFILLLALSGCYYDREIILYPDTANTTCTTVTSATLTQDVMPLLTAKCNGCHSGQYPAGGIDLTTYTNIKQYATKGNLLGSVNQTAGYSAMPKNAGKMAVCDIKKIQLWVESGVLNN